MEGISSGAAASQGNGLCQKASSVAKIITNVPRKAVSRSDSEVAEMTTGTLISSEKGLVSPPVR